MGQWDQHEGMNGGLNGGVKTGINAMTDDPRAQMEEVIEKARGEVEKYVNVASDFIRERPVASVAGAIALGWLIGKLASRR